jgi:hypothetical protein
LTKGHAQTKSGGVCDTCLQVSTDLYFLTSSATATNTTAHSTEQLSYRPDLQIDVSRLAALRARYSLLAREDYSGQQRDNQECAC